MATLVKPSVIYSSRNIITQRFLIKLKTGREGSCMPKLPINKKERNYELDGRIYRQLSHCPLVDNTIPIIVDVIPEPYVPSNLRKVESAQVPIASKSTARGAANIYINMEDISDNECEYDFTSASPSPWKKNKLDQSNPPKSIWSDRFTYCCYDCSSFAGFSGITCIANDEDGSPISDSNSGAGAGADPNAYSNADSFSSNYNDLDDGNVYSNDYTTEENLVPNSYYFGSPTTLRALLKTYNTMRGI
jgi:hypothetical protein